MQAVKILVNGIVQGVGFRFFCRKKAFEYGISGYAKNLPDGGVEVFAQGAEGLLRDYIKQVTTGPAHAEVTSVIVTEAKPDNGTFEFRIF